MKARNLTWMGVPLVFILGITVVTCNRHGDHSVYRCKAGHEVFEHNKKSECTLKPFTSELNCDDAPKRYICLNVKEICEKVWDYASEDPTSWGATTASTTTATSSTSTASPTSTNGTTLCADSYEGDGDTCDGHVKCEPVDGGIALCCRSKCVHVHNVPGVRGFFAKEDRYCSDSDWENQFGVDNEKYY